MNQFRDQNPYESPIVAELARPEPVRPRKPWPPFFSIFWLAVGPFICLWLFRYCFIRGWVVHEDDAIYLLFYVTSGALWLTAGARVITWLVRF